jgi:hypothetical protein
MAERQTAMPDDERIDVTDVDISQASQKDRKLLVLDQMQLEDESQQPRSKIRLFAVLIGLYVRYPCLPP